eukprot:6021445-Amphidinium_carterae.1
MAGHSDQQFGHGSPVDATSFRIKLKKIAITSGIEVPCWHRKNYYVHASLGVYVRVAKGQADLPLDSMLE